MSTDEDENAGTTAVREGYRFDEARLEEWLSANVPNYQGPLSVEQFKGGQSNPTYKLNTPGRSYVLRRKPPGLLLKSAHAVDREYQVITALGKTGFPVARTYGLCTDDAVIGTWFYIMDCVDGRIVWDTTFPDVPTSERAAYFDAMNATIAQLHLIDSEAAGLGDYGKPGNYFARQIGRWSKQYLEDVDAGREPMMDRLVEWLPANIPADEPQSRVIHGDFRCDNMIFHPTEPRVLAVLDWELSTLGHPLADFSYHCMSWHIPPGQFRGIGGLDLASLGIPPEDEYIRRYCDRTGLSTVADLKADWNFYMAYNMFRIAAILQGIAKRVEAGTASSAQAAASGASARPMAELAWQFAQRA